MNKAARSEPQKMPQYASNGGEPLGEPVGETQPTEQKKLSPKADLTIKFLLFEGILECYTLKQGEMYAQNPSFNDPR